MQDLEDEDRACSGSSGGFFFARDPKIWEKLVIANR